MSELCSITHTLVYIACLITNDMTGWEHFLFHTRPFNSNSFVFSHSTKNDCLGFLISAYQDNKMIPIMAY